MVPQLSSRLFSNPMPWDRPPLSSPSISINHGRRVHLQNSHDYGLPVLLCVPAISASKCICKLAVLRPAIASLSSLDLNLQVHLWICSNTSPRCIPKFTGFWPPSASRNWLDCPLQVHHQILLLMVQSNGGAPMEPEENWWEWVDLVRRA